ncbi:MAG: DUF4936 family protein [Burkholderiales bacterium]|nr:DUF4936 family protein [Burkholderiales bacterium]
MRELFVYYRVNPLDAVAVRAGVDRLQAELRARFPHLVARLLCGGEADGEWQTWMETYATDPALDHGGIDTALQSEIETQARVLLPMLDGLRHSESFVACAS